MPRRGSSPATARNPRRRIGAALAALALLVPVAACGEEGGDAPTTEAAAGGTQQLTELNVGLLPIVDVAPLFLGVKKGFFAKRGIDLKSEMAQAGPDIVPGVVTGKFDIGFANMTSLLANQGKKQPIQVVASGVASTGKKGLDYGAVVATRDSPLRRPRDLEGKKILVNAPKSLGDTTVRESVRRDGGDPKKLTFIPKALPEMQAALEAGEADAAWVVEPWLAVTKGTGGRVVAWNYVDLHEGLTVAAYFTSNAFAQKEPDLLKRFTEAQVESMRFANAHPDQVRDVMQTYMTIEPVLTASMTLPFWPDEVNRESVERLASLGVQDKLFPPDARPDVNKLLPAT